MSMGNNKFLVNLKANGPTKIVIRHKWEHFKGAKVSQNIEMCWPNFVNIISILMFRKEFNKSSLVSKELNRVDCRVNIRTQKYALITCKSSLIPKC